MNIEILFDANTISADYAEIVCREAMKQGTVMVRRAYGFLGRETAKRKKLTDAGFQLYETPQEKRAACLLLVDFMRTLDNINIEEIILVTADAYTIPVITCGLEKGKQVQVMSTEKCDKAFLGCGSFRYLEVLAGRSCNGHITPVNIIIEDIQEMLIQGKSKGTGIRADEVISYLQQRHCEFDIRNYGFTGFEEFVKKNMKNAAFTSDGTNTCITLIDDRSEIELFITSYLAENDNKIEDMADLFQALEKEFEGFDTRNYGYTSEIAFILSFPKLEIYNNKGIKLKQTFKLAELRQTSD